MGACIVPVPVLPDAVHSLMSACIPTPARPKHGLPPSQTNVRRQHPVTAASQSPSSTHITLHHNSDNSEPLVHSSTCTIAGRLFSQLTDMLRFYLAFPIDPIEGDPLTDDQVIARHYSRVQQLQRLLFKHHPQLQELALANCGAVASKSRLSAAVRGLQEDVLRTLVTKQLRSGTLHKTVLPVPCVAWMKGWLSSDRQGNCCATAMQVQALCASCTLQCCCICASPHDALERQRFIAGCKQHRHSCCHAIPGLPSCSVAPASKQHACNVALCMWSQCYTWLQAGERG